MLSFLIIGCTIGVIVFGLLAFILFRTRRTVLATIFALLCLVFALGDIKFSQFNKLASMPQTMPATTVTSAVVKEEDWAPVLSAVGSISAVQGAVVASELGGVVSQIAFENGGTAKKGDLLVQLDASAEQAQLKSAEADRELARSDLARERDLVSRKVISQAELDAAESKFKQKEAMVDQMSSMISKKTVRAPFDGQLGIRDVNVGQMINPGQPVVPLTSLDPVFADFALPQQHLGQLAGGYEVKVTTDAL